MGPPCRQAPPTIHRLHTSTTTRLSSPRPLAPSSPRHLLLLLVVAVYTLAGASMVSSFSLQGGGGGGGHCQIDHCFEQYNSAKQALQKSGSAGQDAIAHPMGGGPVSGHGVGGGGGGLMGGGVSGGGAGGDVGLELDSQCVALRTYWSCIQATKNSSRGGCQGDIGYYSVRNGVKRQMVDLNCSEQGPTVDPTRDQGPPTPRQVPPQCRLFQDGSRSGGGGAGASSHLAHCGLFGDPHLRTFGQKFQTCRVKGAWPLVNNQHLTVQVTNHPVLGAAGDATATSKLTVIVKSRPECGWDHYHTYQAQTNDLPAAFEDGHTNYGHYNSVRLLEVDPGRHVEIVLEHIATRLIVRQIGRYFTFAIHMPRELVPEGMDSPEPELCSKGCPPSEVIDYKRYLAHKKDRLLPPGSSPLALSRGEAEDTCRRAGLVDFYFDSCVFDLLATGDSNFTVAALSALQDVVRLDPSMAHVANRTSLDIYDDLFSGAGTPFAGGTLWWWWWSWWWRCGVSCGLSLLWTLWLTSGGCVVPAR